MCCSGQPTGSIKLVTGMEEGVFSREPAPRTLVVERLSLEGKAEELARAALPVDTVDLGTATDTDVAIVRVRAEDPAGKVLVAGTSLPVTLGATRSAPLLVFVQRTGELARLPSPFALAPRASQVGILAGRYALTADDTTTALYDLANLSPLASPPRLPRAARSIATFGESALVLDDAGGAYVFDFTSSQVTEVKAPDGGSFEEVAGGSRVQASDGTAYLVGATRRTGDATSRVLRIDPSGTLSFASLTQARRGAAALWIEGRGLLVAGGSGGSAGLEILGPGAAQAATLPFPPDPREGGAAALLDASHALLVGGLDPAGGPLARAVDLACTSACAAVAWSAPAGLTLPRVDALGLEGGKGEVLVVGDDGSGATHALRGAAGALTELPLRVPRRGARLLALPTGNLGIVGGATTIESFRP